MLVLQILGVLAWTWAVFWSYTGSFTSFPRTLWKGVLLLGGLMTLAMLLAIMATLPIPGDHSEQKEAS